MPKPLRDATLLIADAFRNIGWRFCGTPMLLSILLLLSYWSLPDERADPAADA